ncbi:MAG: threonine--tRNA ligase [Planctomycetes bacterium]|nr:threonine--tRNA ligase [Planctomycetota bacterium]
MITLTLPDGSTRTHPEGVTGRELAASLSAALAREAVAIKLNGRLMDLDRPIREDAAVAIITPRDDDADALYVIRHSCAHVMAEAVQRLYPGTRLVYGPPLLEDAKYGFYYDVDAPEAITVDDLPRIAAEMEKIIAEDRPFGRREMSREEALRCLVGDPYKTDNVTNADGDVISFYTQGVVGQDFEDLCMGPHVPSTGWVRHFKLQNVAGSYWKGDENLSRLQRLYGNAFATAAGLQAHDRLMAELARRDHRRIGRDLDWFSFHPEAPGHAFWHPRGTILYQVLSDYIRAACRARGYEEVRTPTVLKRFLWERSGHWDNYKDKMYHFERERESYAVKPMNCPGSVVIFQAGHHSYRDLPRRWAELGFVHRHESGGEVQGLLRVRGFTQDDAHIYCAPDQVEDEAVTLIDFVFDVYRTFGFENVHVELSTRPEKHMGSAEHWDLSERALLGALARKKIDYKLNPGEGAFYGPKIDFHLTDCLNRRWQCGTIQVDFNFPEKFDLTYADRDNQPKRLVMLHRTILGSFERFLGILIEHYAGALPVWLMPVQVRVASLTERQLGAAAALAERLSGAGVRAEADLRNEKVGLKVRDAERDKIPYLIVLGDREVTSGMLAVRGRGRRDLGTMAPEAFLEHVRREIAEQTLP